MNDQDNTRVIRDLFAAYKRGDIQSVLNGLADDVVWEVPGPPHVPSAGRRFGREEVARFFQTMKENVEIRTFEPREYIAEGDKVAAVGHTSGRARTTGREYVSDFVMVFTMRGGKVAEFRQYLDTGALAGAFDTGTDKLAGLPATPGSNDPMAGPHTSTYRQS